MSLRKNDIFMIFIAFVLGFITQMLIKTICGDVVEGAKERESCKYMPKKCNAKRSRNYPYNDTECVKDDDCQVEDADKTQNMRLPNAPQCVHPRGTQYCKDGSACPSSGMCPSV